MIPLTNKEASLLGLLSEGPKYPYEIEKEIDNRSMRDWTEISMSSVYKVLERLEQRGLVASEVKLSESNRAQKVYQATAAGLEQMRSWVITKISSWERCLWPLDIAISNLPLLSREETVEGLESYIRSVDKAIQCYQDLLGYLKEHCQSHSWSLALRPLHLLRAEKAWAEEVVEGIRA
jgi:DNA-binding PadR family transcriptional regulator